MHDINTDNAAASRTEVDPVSVRRARREEFRRTIEILAELFPAVFVADKRAPHRPLKIRIHSDLVATGLVTPRKVRNTLVPYTGRLQYQRAVAAGGPRFDLHGNVVGEVTIDQIEHAAAAVARIEAKAVAKADALRRQKAARTAAKKRAIEQQPASRTSPTPPPPPTSSDSAAPQRDGIAALKRAALAKKEGRL